MPPGATPAGAPPPGPVFLGSPRVERLRPVGDLMTFMTRGVVDRFGHVFTVMTIVAIPILAVTLPLLWFGFSELVVLTDEDGLFAGVEGFTTALGWQMGIATVVSLAGYALMFSAITNLAAAPDRTWREGMIGGLNALPRVFGVLLQVLVVFFIANVIGGVVAGLVPVLGAIAILGVLVLLALVWIRSAVAGTIASLRAQGASLPSSVRLTKGVSVPLFGRMVLLLSINLMVQIIVIIVNQPFVGAGPTPGARRIPVSDFFGSDPAGFAVAQIVSTFGALLCIAFWAVAMLAVYDDLTVGPPPPEPANTP